MTNLSGSELPQPIFIEAKNGLVDLAAGFEWENPESKSNQEVIEESIVGIAEELGCPGEKQDLSNFVKKIRSESIEIYRGIYPAELSEVPEKDKKKGILKEPFYHGVGTESDWIGHNDYVMAAASRLFLGMAKLQKENLKPEEVERYDLFFGQGWRAEKLDIGDFQGLMALACFHEAGEWWVRKIWQDALAAQRSQFENQKLKGTPIREIKIDPRLKDIVACWPEAEKEPLVEEMKAVILKVIKSTSGLGLEIEYNPDDTATEFYFKFKDGSVADLDFASPKSSGGDKASILAALYRAADFSQCISPSYLKKVEYQNEKGQRDGKLQGPLLLWPEFYSFRPVALSAYGWSEPENSTISAFFSNSFFNPNFNNPSVRGILKRAFGDDNNPYTERLSDFLDKLDT